MILFLGSGVSVPTGLPRVDALVEAVLWGDWHRGTDQLFYRGKCQDFVMADPTESVQRFLRHVKALADAAHAKRGIDPANYEDLFFLLQQVVDQERGEHKNSAIEPFIAGLRSEVEFFPVNQGHTGMSSSPLTVLASMGCNLIQSVVRHELSTDKTPVGLDLVCELARREAVSIVTLNHDLLVERSLAVAGVDVVDGFGVPDGEVRWFEHSLLAPSDKTRLLKLHGSINWFRMSKKQANESVPKTAIPLNLDPWHCKTAANETLSNWNGEPLFLTGVGNKMASYNLGIFAEIFFRFHEALKSTDTVVMSGYGWGDRGVNTRLIDWLFDDSKHRLVMLHENPDEFVERPTPLTHRRDFLRDRGQLIEIKKWMKDVSLAELDEVLAAPQHRATEGEL